MAEKKKPLDFHWFVDYSNGAGHKPDMLDFIENKSCRHIHASRLSFRSYQKEMRHLVLITTSYPFENSGSEAAGAFVADLVEVLADHVRVTVVAPGLSASDETTTGNLTVKRFAVTRLPLSLLNILNPTHWYSITQALFSGKNAVSHVVKSTPVSHILALWVLPSGYWAMNAGTRFCIPYSTWALGSDIWSLEKIPVIRTILKKVLNESCCNFADGHLLKNDVKRISKKECLFLPSTRKIVTPHNKNYSKSPPFRFAFLGRWHPNKGIDLLLDCLRMLEESDWKQIGCVKIFGGGPLDYYVKESVGLLQANGRPVFSGGYLGKDEAVELFLWADYVLIPSRIESIPVVFSDAMKCDCPVVCMPVGDLPKLVSERVVGMVADEISAKAFADAIRRIVKYAPAHFKDGVESTAKMFSLDQISRMLLQNLF